MTTIIALTNQKGGVGKTTTSSALAAGLSSFYNKKVLAIDLDPQGSLGFSLGLDIENSSTIYDVLKGNVPIQDAIQTTDYCDIITSNILLSGAELEFTSADRELCLKKALAPVIDHYDFIIIDTPPALNILTVNAYVAADHLIIPMAPEILSLLGLTQLKETIDSVRTWSDPYQIQQTYASCKRGQRDGGKYRRTDWLLCLPYTDPCQRICRRSACSRA